MKNKCLYLLLSIFLVGCQATGIKPMKNSQLNGQNRVSISNPVVKTNRIIEKELVIVVPKTTNYFEIYPTKELIESKKPIKLEIVSQPSTHTVQLKVAPEQKNEVIGNNFLIFWYGTLVLGGVFYFIYKVRNRHKNKEKKIVDVIPKDV